MGTVPVPPAPEPSKADSLLREAIAGHPRGAVRRIVLWTVAELSLAALAYTNNFLAFLICMAAMVLLITTDQLI